MGSDPIYLGRNGVRPHWVHMNGRVYDPELGRFLSADPFIQAPYNSQSFNRYSYVMNNPLGYVDPSGFFFEFTESFLGQGFIGAVVDNTVDAAADWAEEQVENFIQDTIDYINDQWDNFLDGDSLAAGFVRAHLEIVDSELIEPLHDAQDITRSLRDGEYKTAAVMTGVAVADRLGGRLVPDKVKDKAKEVAQNVLDVTKKADTPHTQVPGGNKIAGAPNTGQPNSIHEQTRPDGSKSVTYYDEKGRMFSREDYGQQRKHGQLGRGPDGRSVPHEHRVDWSDQGPIGKSYRELDITGKPVGSWINE